MINPVNVALCCSIHIYITLFYSFFIPHRTVLSFAQFVICLISHPPARREAQVICLGLTEMTAFTLC